MVQSVQTIKITIKIFPWSLVSWSTLLTYKSSQSSVMLLEGPPVFTEEGQVCDVIGYYTQRACGFLCFALSLLCYMTNFTILCFYFCFESEKGYCLLPSSLDKGITLMLVCEVSWKWCCSMLWVPQGAVATTLGLVGCLSSETKVDLTNTTDTNLKACTE